MLTGTRKQHIAAGFARGLLKCANAAQALEDAARVVANPGTRRTMAALGHDIFDSATKSENPFGAFHKFLFANPHQIDTIAATMKSFEHLAQGASPEMRAILQAKHDALLQDQMAELGTAASGKIRFMNNAVPAAAGVGITAPIAMAAGNITGRHQEDSKVQDELSNLPIQKRLQYALFPQSVFPKPQPYYDRIPGQTGSTE